MKTNQELIEKYKLTASGNEITLVSTEDITKQIIAVLITHPDSFKNLWIGRELIEEDKLTIELNFKADLDKFLSINDFRKALLENCDKF